MTTTTNAVNMTALAEAIEARDADAVIAWYDTDATFTLHDRAHPPSDPLKMVGIAAIEEYYRDLCGRNMDHRIEDAVATPEGLAFTQRCRYPDGSAVVCVTVARTRDGKIQEQTGVQVWDD